MRVLFLIQGWERPSSRYRVLQYLPYLEKWGVKTDVAIYPQNIRKYASIYRNTMDYDLIFLQRKRLNPLSLYFLRERAKRMVYDFDDAVMYKDSKASLPYSRTREKRFARIVKASDHVIAGNSFLYDQAKEYNSSVTVIPTAIDIQKYRIKNYEGKEKITIGWIGSSSTLPYLTQIKGIFEDLGKKYSNIQLKIICDSFFDCEYIPVIKKVWSHKDEIEDLMSIDIGVMPLLNDIWSRGKCGLKILQYYGVGVPVICTPVGVNRDVVHDGVNGFWAMDNEEWLEKLCLLIEDPSLRQKMGIQGRELVQESYSVQGCAPKFYEVLEEVVQRGI